MIYASIKRTMDDLLPITGAGRLDNINFLSRRLLTISRSYLGAGTGNRVSSDPVLSADGRTVAFQSFAGDLVPGDYNDTRDVFIPLP